MEFAAWSNFLLPSPLDIQKYKQTNKNKTKQKRKQKQKNKNKNKKQKTDKQTKTKQMSAILKFDFQTRKQLRQFFWSKLSKLHKKDPILHVATTFFLKQGETRTNHGPIPHPLKTDLAPYQP